MSMNEDSKELKEKIEKWVRDQGFPLEMRVRKAMLPHIYMVPSAYRDSETGKYREGADVVGLTSKSMDNPTPEVNQFRASMFMVVECKSGSKSPWVGFLNNYEESDQLYNISMLQFLTSSRAASGIVERIVSKDFQGALVSKLGESSPFLAPTMLAYSMMDCKFRKEDQSVKQNAQNVAYNAVRQVIDSAEGVISEFDIFYSSLNRVKFISAAANFIVTGSRLFTCELDNHGRELVKETDNIVFLESRGQGQQQRYHYVRVVTEEYFNRNIILIVDHLKVVSEHLLQVFIKHRE